MLKTNVVLNVGRAGVQTCIDGVKKGEVNVHTLVFSLIHNSIPFPIPEGSVAELYCLKPDGTTVYSSCLVDDGFAEHTLTSQECAVAGLLKCELRIQLPKGQDDIIPLMFTPEFTVFVDDTLYSEDAEISENENTVWTETLERIRALEEKTYEVPYIGENGNWFLGSEDTGVCARGNDGKAPILGVDYFTDADKAEMNNYISQELEEVMNGGKVVVIDYYNPKTVTDAEKEETLNLLLSIDPKNDIVFIRADGVKYPAEVTGTNNRAVSAYRTYAITDGISHVRYLIMQTSTGITFASSTQSFYNSKLLDGLIMETLTLKGDDTDADGKAIKSIRAIAAEEASAVISNSQSEKFYINIEKSSADSSVATADKTFEEIFAAKDAGFDCIAIYENNILPLISISDNSAQFGICSVTPSEGGKIVGVTVSNEGCFAYSENVSESVEVDSFLSLDSVNPVQNKIVFAALNSKANRTDTLKEEDVAGIIEEKAPRVFMAEISPVDDSTATADKTYNDIVAAFLNGSSVYVLLYGFLCPLVLLESAGLTFAATFLAGADYITVAVSISPDDSVTYMTFQGTLFSGSYNDLTDKPTILTEAQVNALIDAKLASQQGA